MGLANPWLFLVTWFVMEAFQHHQLYMVNPISISSEEANNTSTTAFDEATQKHTPYGAAHNATNSPANITTSNKAAVIVETNTRIRLVPLILHFCAMPGPSWPLVFYTSAENFGSFLPHLGSIHTIPANRPHRRPAPS